MSKENEVNFEEVKQAKIDAVNEVKAAKKALVKFRKENKIKADEKPEDKKLLKTYQKLVAEVEAKEKTSKEAQAAFKAAKPNSGKGGFATKYTYPMVTLEDGTEREMTKDEKKKYRSAARAAAKKAEKAENKAATGKDEPAAEKKTKKKVKKKTEKEAPASDEDDD